ncbi:hypothetical protein BO221_39715 [Archangium sp. Cb G35]|uniref:SMI1/KNR4 family protein n=1 Tax=Archangium sp. Cb G35 TaxID=1920190 RepID=UPI0009372021|nr:SMI1/KNR4 family protein [Archangium sp. Cb G35]OJT18847.1 hypothetical protein BO221_39715 [Archangium sp. Cb G35]
MLQEFIALAEHYDPGYSRRLQGARPEEIRNLEVLAGQPLPDSYREFLTRLGRDMGGLEIEGVNFHIERILEFYKSGDWPPPKGYILFAIQEDDPQMDYYLECTRPGQRDCPVVRFPSMGEFSRDGYFDSLDPSLNDFLLSLAFSEKRMEDFDLQRLLIPSTQSKKQGPEHIESPIKLTRVIEERAHRLGFERVGTTSVAYRFYDQPDAALYVRLDGAGGLMGVTAAARNPRDLERISDILSNQTSLVVA